MTGLFDPVMPTAAAKDVVEMLRAHYLPANRPPSGIFAVEIEAPAGSRRADVIWAPMTTYGDVGLVGHEIKVSRSDLIGELADPTKADPWARHCSRWWLTVSDPSIIAGLEIPDAWGIMAPPAGRRRRSMSIIRQAPRLNPPNDGPAWHRLAAWQHYRLTRRQEELERDAAFRTQELEQLRGELRSDEFRRFGREAPEAERVGRLLRAIEQRRHQGPVYIGHDDLTDDDIVDAILDLGRTRSMTDQLGDDLRWRLKEATAIAKSIDQLAKQLATLTEKKKGTPGRPGRSEER